MIGAGCFPRKLKARSFRCLITEIPCVSDEGRDVFTDVLLVLYQSPKQRILGRSVRRSVSKRRPSLCLHRFFNIPNFCMVGRAAIAADCKSVALRGFRRFESFTMHRQNIYRSVAQLDREHRSPESAVTGSSPVTPANTSRRVNPNWKGRGPENHRAPGALESSSPSPSANL